MACSDTSFDGVNHPFWPVFNWVPTFVAVAREYFEPAHSAPDGPADGLRQLVHVVQRAGAEGKGVRVKATGWAYEDLVRPDHWSVNIKNLNRVLDYIVGSGGAALTDRWRDLHANSEHKLVHVEAGITIADLNLNLEAAGLAMRTLGGANAQQLGGVISTSTHGGDWNEPPFPDFVRAIHLVTDGGRELWIERKSDPITQDDRLSPLLPCPETQIIRDDAVFDAAVVSCGRFGVIYALVLEVRPAFRVVEVTTPQNRPAVLAALRDGVTTGDLRGPLFTLLRADTMPTGLAEAADGRLDADPSFFQLLFNSQNRDDLWVQRRWETTEKDDLKPDTGVGFGISGPDLYAIAVGAVLLASGPVALIPIVGPFLSLGLLAVAASLGVRAHADPVVTLGDALENILEQLWATPLASLAIPGISKAVIESRFTDSILTGRRGPHHLLTSGSKAASENIDYRADYIEVMFDATTVGWLDFLDSILASTTTWKQCGYISVRPSRTSRALLSMHAFESPYAVSIEVTTLAGLPDNAAWMAQVQREAVAHGGRPHWGQYNDVDEVDVLVAYGARLMRWREALVRTSGSSMTFSNAFTRRRGLEPQNLMRVVRAVRRTQEGNVTHLCGGPDATWPIVTAADAILQIQTGFAQYLSVDPAGTTARITVVDGRYLRTVPDASQENNLDNLPEC